MADRKAFSRTNPREIVAGREIAVMRLLARKGGTPSAIAREMSFTRHPARILRLLCDLAERQMVFMSEKGRWHLTLRGYHYLAALDENPSPEPVPVAKEAG